MGLIRRRVVLIHVIMMSFKTHSYSYSHSYWRDLGNNYTTIPAYFKGQGYEPRLLPAQLIRFLTYPSLLYGYIANLGSTNVAI